MHNLLRITAVLLSGLSLNAVAQVTSWKPGATESIPSVWDTYRSLPIVTNGGDLIDAVLVCKAEVSGGWDTFAGADLSMSFTVRGHSVTLYGSNDSNVATVSFPTTLKLGDTVSVTVWDRDVMDNEVIGSASARYQGTLPLELKGKWMMVDCRAVTNEVTRARAQAAVQRADEALRQVESSLLVDFTDDALGAPNTGLKNARDAMETAAAWAGWSVDGLPELVKREAKVSQAWRQLLATDVKRTASTLPAKTAFATLQPGITSGRVSELRCVSSRQCTVTVEVRNDSKRPITFDAYAPGEAFDRFEVLQENGLPVPFMVTAPTSRQEAPARQSLAPSATLSLTLKQRCDEFAGCQSFKGVPSAARAHTPFGWRLLSLRD